MKTASRALVRDVPDTFTQCITTYLPAGGIDVALAKQQHIEYCNTLKSLGLSLIRLPADDTLPDCCFPEDCVIILDELAIITRPGAVARRGETEAVEQAVSEHFDIRHIKAPATIDGGDVLKINKTLYIGLSKRTTRTAVDQVAEIAAPLGYDIIPVEISGVLHLQSVCTYAGENCVLVAPGYFDVGVLKGLDKMFVPEKETYSANCLAVNGTVFLPSGYPETEALVESRGFEVLTLGMSEFEKAEGALTCLSVLF